MRHVPLRVRILAMQGIPFEIEPGHREPLREAGLLNLASCACFGRGVPVKSKLEGREVRSFESLGKSYFLKSVRGSAAPEVVHEARLLKILEVAGFPSAPLVALGAEPGFAAMVTVGLSNVGTVESVLTSDSCSKERRIHLAKGAGELLRKLHDLGINHRDFYSGHLLLDSKDSIFVVDFGRAERRRKVPVRRIIKDLAAFQSSLPERLCDDELRTHFLGSYLGEPPDRRWHLRIATFVARKAERMRRHVRRQCERGHTNFHVRE